MHVCGQQALQYRAGAAVGRDTTMLAVASGEMVYGTDVKSSAEPRGRGPVVPGAGGVEGDGGGGAFQTE